MNRRKRLKRWLKEVWENLMAHRRPLPIGDRNRPTRQKPDSTNEADKLRYEVRNEQGLKVSQADTLQEAHQQWQQFTDQQGRIIDAKTGDDVTPEPDDKDRYVVLDADNQQLGSFGNIQLAVEHWRSETNESGKIIDVLTRQELTAQHKGYLTQAQLDQALNMLGRQFTLGFTHLGINPELVRWMAKDLNRFKLPIFNVTNITGSNRNVPKETIPVTRREVIIEKVREVVEVEAPGPKSPSSKVEVPYPTDEQDIRHIRRVGDISRVSVSRLVLPRPELERRLARRQLPMAVYQEEIPGKPTVQKRKVWQEVERPKVREWTEQVEIAEEEKAQLLEIVVDVSPSMTAGQHDISGVARINMAMAVAVLLVGKHLDDGSRYYYRQFAGIVGELRKAETSAEKRHFLHFLVNQTEDRVGTGTNIRAAVNTAANDVRVNATRGDRPEILLLSDGDGEMSAEEVYEALGHDVTLHTVITNSMSGNFSLKSHSTTYYRLGYNGQALLGWDF